MDILSYAAMLMKDLKKDFLKISERLQRYAYKTSKLHMVFISESSGKVMTNIVVMGFGIRKKKEVIFYLNDEMTFTKTMFQRYHIPWYHDEIQKTVLLDYNIYHLKIIKREDCIKRMSGIHLAIPVFSKGYRPKQGKVVP